MNWTGGRLRRHSAIHAKSRKQKFKKQSTNTNPMATGAALLDLPADCPRQAPGEVSISHHRHEVVQDS
ncbi:uncharacterized protein BO72DRAFT_452302 [Aspergillus fijiensis CBS 313.89]|uniref:Uncharacterized protein n=1 Tax=Aspergillus fijiensis CBS 313.89 TaxID=1448319 RepID=A0A8G1VTX1_9EURO|nr:uncharacterized protein BO72DRAFT_452302 [Aspergillus fijiensis CBS 313.89]RAK72810.1 hypothetical protein BO72DRAFT_452302 [Aspergillus fijiensis CBS 313.89]